MPPVVSTNKGRLTKSKRTPRRKKTGAFSQPTKRTPDDSASPGQAASEPSRQGTASKPEQTPPATRKAPETLLGHDKKTLLRIPPILLEGDEPSAVPMSGPGQKSAAGPTPPLEQLEAEDALPEAYGTRRLLLVARDPHWLYAHWDLTRDEQFAYNSMARDRHLVLRIHVEAVSANPRQEVQVHPESRYWFIPVEQPGAMYLAELGYYAKSGDWAAVSISAPARTPPETISADTSVEFATIPFEVPLVKLQAWLEERTRGNVPLAKAARDLRARNQPGLSETSPVLLSPKQSAVGPMVPAAPPQWTCAQEQALARILSKEYLRHTGMGSLEITELMRQQFVEELASLAAAQLHAGPWEEAPTSPMGAAPGGVSSPGGRPELGEKGFWFNVNAELVIYGATEPDVKVTIGGRLIQLRPDGSFSYRFALPDGQYELPIVAVSADQTDSRIAEMKFSRITEYHGEVGTHPAEANLMPPDPTNL